MIRTHSFFWALIGILLLGGFLRFYQITEIPPGLYPDEAMNGSNALEALATGSFKIFYPENNGREGLFINIQALSVWLFGNEAWALRVVSAMVGTLTILGVYLAGKELFHTNPKHEIRSTKQYQNSNDQNLKPFRSFGFGYLNLFRISNFEFRISRGEMIALLAAFFTATSYWHLNFSRVGFRAITLPFFATFAMYFLLKGLRRGKILDLVWAGVFMGLGFHGYIAFRFMPFVVAIPILMCLWRYYRHRKLSLPASLPGASGRERRNNLEANVNTTGLPRASTALGARNDGGACTPCAMALFLFVVFVVALPIGIYFLQNPQDFVGRSGQVSVLASSAPIKEFLIASAKTIGMFFWSGDCNWRHNYACQPELNIIVAIFFATGLFMSLAGFLKRTNPKHEIRSTKQIQISNVKFTRSLSLGVHAPILRQGFGLSQIPNPFRSFGFRIWDLFRISNFEFRISEHALPYLTLLAWLFFMSLPATLTTESLPHALRAIGMIPPVMILAAAGVHGVGEWIEKWFKKQGERRPLYQAQLRRITRELFAALGLLVLLVAPMTFRTYFNRWAYHEQTYDAFSASFVHIAEYLNRLPRDVHAYVLVNMGGTEVRSIPMPAQTVMYLTDTFRQENRVQRRIAYVTAAEDIPQAGTERMIVIPMNGRDNAAIASLKRRFPDFAFQASSDFLVFEKR